jgi:hypothetical protein
MQGQKDQFQFCHESLLVIPCVAGAEGGIWDRYPLRARQTLRCRNEWKALADFWLSGLSHPCVRGRKEIVRRLLLITVVSPLRAGTKGRFHGRGVAGIRRAPASRDESEKRDDHGTEEPSRPRERGRKEGPVH